MLIDQWHDSSKLALCVCSTDASLSKGSLVHRSSPRAPSSGNMMAIGDQEGMEDTPTTFEPQSTRNSQSGRFSRMSRLSHGQHGTPDIHDLVTVEANDGMQGPFIDVAAIQSGTASLPAGQGRASSDSDPPHQGMSCATKKTKKSVLVSRKVVFLFRPSF